MPSMQSGRTGADGSRPSATVCPLKTLLPTPERASSPRPPRKWAYNRLEPIGVQPIIPTPSEGRSSPSRPVSADSTGNGSPERASNGLKPPSVATRRPSNGPGCRSVPPMHGSPPLTARPPSPPNGSLPPSATHHRSDSSASTVTNLASAPNSANGRPAIPRQSDASRQPQGPDPDADLPLAYARARHARTRGIVQVHIYS